MIVGPVWSADQAMLCESIASQKATNFWWLKQITFHYIYFEFLDLTEHRQLFIWEENFIEC